MKTFIVMLLIAAGVISLMMLVGLVRKAESPVNVVLFLILGLLTTHYWVMAEEPLWFSDVEELGIWKSLLGLACLGIVCWIQMFGFAVTFSEICKKGLYYTEPFKKWTVAMWILFAVLNVIGFFMENGDIMLYVSLFVLAAHSVYTVVVFALDDAFWTGILAALMNVLGGLASMLTLVCFIACVIYTAMGILSGIWWVILIILLLLCIGGGGGKYIIFRVD